MAEDTQINARIRQILTDLEGVRENLMTLSDAIWLNIDHNDVVALHETIRIMGEIDEVIESHGDWSGAFADKEWATDRPADRHGLPG